MLTKLARALRAVSLAVWLGGGVMTFIVAQQVFKGGYIKSHDEAGDVMGAILHIGGWLKFGLAILALAAQWMLRADPTTRKFSTISLVIAALLVCVAVFYLEPTLVDLRTQFRGGVQNEAYEKFKHLHGASMGMSLLELILVAVATICSAL